MPQQKRLSLVPSSKGVMNNVIQMQYKYTVHKQNINVSYLICELKYSAFHIAMLVIFDKRFVCFCICLFIAHKFLIKRLHNLDFPSLSMFYSSFK